MTKLVKTIDWEKIEFDYRAGILSLREIAVTHGITEGAIRKRAKRDSWDRDLTAKIKSKAESLVRKELVRNEVRNSPEYQATEKEIVEANASLQANALLDHRKDIKRHRNLSIALLAEVEAQTNDHELFEKLGELMRQEDDKGQDKLNEVYRKVISTPSRIDSMKKMSDTLKTLIALEREAIGLDDKEAAKDGGVIDDFLKRCSGRSLPVVADDE